MTTMQEFKHYEAELSGTNLIEASAGTGKTYAISTLFVRLVLESELTVDQILVVTYTTAATAELRRRIRQKLDQFRQALVFLTETGDADALSEKLVDSELAAYLLKFKSNAAAALRKIETAIAEFDKVAIDTIHGFCRKALQDYAFEGGRLFDTELIQDHSDIVYEIVADFLRQHLYTCSPEFVAFAVEHLELEALFEYVFNKLLYSNLRILPEASLSPTNEVEENYRRARADFTREWQHSNKAAEAAIAAVASKLRQTPEQLHADIDAFCLSVQAGQSREAFPQWPPALTSLLEKLPRQKWQPAALFDSAQKLQQAYAQLKKDFEQRLVALKSNLLEFVRTELESRKDERNVYFFDDLLIRLNDALRQPQSQLAAALRAKYRAALIDEFQDTDMEQYLIFKQIFFNSTTIVFLIGDPKQAIYRFRGADIFSYIKAKKDASRVYTLRTNYRSTPGLVTAINILFGRDMTPFQPFVYDDIPFLPSQSGENPERDELVITDAPCAPLQVWLLDSSRLNEGKRISAGKARDWICSAAAAEIARLLQLGKNGVAQLGKEKLRESDIAVLVRSKFEGAMMQQALFRLGIYAVMNTAASVFESKEASELLRILTAVANPKDGGLLKAALATDLIGMNAREILELSIDEGKWEKIYDRFNEYHRLWRDAGFTRMFAQMLRDERIPQHVIEYEDGERRITNLMHLAELITQAISQNNLSMTSLLKWFQNRQKVRNKRIEEHQLRLESDENAVKILTMHISKGLQFPVVFATFSWYTYSEDDREILFHDDQQAWKLTLDLGSPQAQENQLKMQMEQLAEDVRLLYVALTRARNLCYFAWGRFNSFGRTLAKRSAPAYLLHTPKVDQPCNPVPPTEAHYFGITDQKIRRTLDELAASSAGAIAVADLPTEPGEQVQPEAVDVQSLTCRSFSAKIDASFRIASYSSLIAGVAHGEELPDYDEVDEPAPEAEEEIVEPAENSFVNFPRGTRTGTFIHSILEEMDFTETDERILQELIESKMQRFGFEKEWLPGVKDLLAAVRSVPLGDIPPDPPSRGGTKGFTLSQVPKSKRLNELEFYFPVESLNPSQLRKIYGEFEMSYRGPFTSRLAEVSFARLTGFMKGFIDMVFEHDGRFYIVDWKSNYLGDTPASYHADALVSAMADSLYFLQYDLYTVALDRFLRLRYPGYRYEEHFGGVYYIFLRGLSASANSGIYFDRPAPAFIERLNGLM